MKKFPSNLEDWLKYIETMHSKTIDMTLDRARNVKNAMDFPIKKPILFVVGGTNGKGSTCSVLENILLSASYKVGCYTSPHFLSITERARINGRAAEDVELLEHFSYVEKIRLSLNIPLNLTYFEFTTLAIMHLLTHSKLDVIIAEIGLGGRLDTVNLWNGDVSIVTNIGIDHIQYLGNTKEQIAYEKAHIFRANCPAIFGEKEPPDTLINYAKAIKSDIWIRGVDFNVQYNDLQWNWFGRERQLLGLHYPILRGTNQIFNASTALAALESVFLRLPVNAQAIRNGLSTIDLPGRFQVFSGSPTVIFDVAHNPEASVILSKNLERMIGYSKTLAIFGIMDDKDIKGVIRSIKQQIHYWYICTLKTQRACQAKKIKKYLKELDINESNMEISEDSIHAYNSAKKKAKKMDRILVFGSFYTVGEIMRYKSQINTT